MTTPVYTTSTDGPAKMQFVMDAPETDALPAPSSGDVAVRQVAPQLVAALKFGGIATDFSVQIEQAKLRGALRRDNVPAEDGFEVARYNEPTAAPWVRRNEILIRLEDGYDPLED